MSERLVFRLNVEAITADDFEAKLDQLWGRIQEDPATAERLKNLRIDVEQFRGHARTDFIQLQKTPAAGLTGLETVVASIISGIVLKLFEVYMIPAITKGLNREDVTLESRAKGQDPRPHEPTES